MKLRKILALLVLNIFINSIECQQFLNEDDFDENDEEVTVEIVTVETTTQEIIIITDIAQEDIDAALNLDVGEYTTQVYDYANFHFRTISKDDYCFQQHLKCILNQGVSHPVCSVNDPFEIPAGYTTYDSICDVFMDNCRRLRHFWRVLGIGRCVFPSDINANIQYTRRESGELRPWTFIFHVLGDQSYKYNEFVYESILT